MDNNLEISHSSENLKPSISVLDLREIDLEKILDDADDSNRVEVAALADRIIRSLAYTGLVMVRLPSNGIDDVTLEYAHISIGGAIGQVMPQNSAGDCVIRVRDTAPVDHETSRGFLSNSAMKLHTDGWDAAGLLCLKSAYNGGESLFARSKSVFERICELRPDLAPILLDNWYCDVRVLCDDPRRPPLKSPIIAFESEQLYCRYGSHVFRNGALAAGKKLSAQRLELLDLFDEVTSEGELQRIITMARGDAIWMNNRTILHGRKAFSDHGPTGRNLSRLWVRILSLRQPNKSFLDFDFKCFGAG